MPAIARYASIVLICASIVYVTACSKNNSNSPTASSASLSSINHVVVLYLENHSFDNLYGEFPGANG